MSQAEDLLNSLTTDSEEEHIIISSDRVIKVPDSLKKIAVQFDNNVRTVTFDCPRYSDGRDLSTMVICINYLLPNGDPGMYVVDAVEVDENDNTLMHFDWIIEEYVTKVNGTLSFLVCAKKTKSDGTNENHWNTELNQEMTISKGLNCGEQIVNQNPDVIAHILLRLDTIESKPGLEFDATEAKENQILMADGNGNWVWKDPETTEVETDTIEEILGYTPLNKNQGTENSGKVAGINESGDIIPMIPAGVSYNEETKCLEYGKDPDAPLMPGIKLDDTLSKNGYAADSKKVGDKFSEIETKVASKITTPENPIVGKILKVRSVNKDGSFVCEWTDAPRELDVQIDGKSIIDDNTANIPLAGWDAPGVIKTSFSFNRTLDGTVYVYDPPKNHIDARHYGMAVTLSTMDYAVKAVMCDGKGDAWTTDEQKAALERIGIPYILIADITLEEAASYVFVDLGNYYENIIVSYTNPANKTDTGRFYNTWITLYDNAETVTNFNAFEYMVSSTMLSRGYVKIEKKGEKLYEIENANYCSTNENLDKGTYYPYNGVFKKNNYTIGIDKFNRVRIRANGDIQFPKESCFQIYAR